LLQLLVKEFLQVVRGKEQEGRHCIGNHYG